MSTQVTFNGLIYTIPATGDESWGDYTSLFLISVAQNTLTKSGGVFELNSDMDFGPSFGLTSVYFQARNSSNSSNVATAGTDLTAPNRLRLGVIPNATSSLDVYDAIAWRNHANSADIRLLPKAGTEGILNYNGIDLANVSSSQSFSNKSIDASTNTLTNITNSSISASAAIAYSKLALSNSIVNADVNSAAAIAGTKISPDFGSQNIITTGSISGAAGSFTAALNMNSQLINNVLDPVSAQDAATKAYVDSVAQGLNVKASVILSSTANVVGVYIGSPTFTLTTAASTLTLDGVAVTNGIRVLLKAQTDAKQNGIYSVSGVGVAVVLTRTADANSSAELESAFVFVEDGSTLPDTGWVMTTNSFILDSSNCAWSQFSGAGTYSASGGIVLTGTNFAIGTSGSNGIDNSMINTAAAIARSKIASGTADHVIINSGAGALSSEAQLAITRGGTGQATANTGFNALAPTTTRGDLIYRDASVNARLAIGAANTILSTNGTDPAWSLIVNANIDSAAAIARSKIAAGTVAHVVINDGSTGLLSSEARLSLSRFAVGTSGLPLVGQGASDSTYAQISLTAAVSGTLPVANGGTGTTFAGALAAEDVILGSSSTAMKRLAVSSDGKVLTISSGAVAWSSGTMSGTNTGDVTLASFGSSANSSGASLAGQVLTLQPASSSQPGGLSTGTQQIAGAKTFMTAMKVRDTAAAFDLSFVSTSSTVLTADRALTFNVQDAARTISMAGNLTVSAAATVSGTNTGDQTITLTGNVTGSGTGSFATTISSGVIVDSMVNASAAIAYSKLALTGSIVNADINASAAIAYSKLNLATSIVNADISASAAIVYSKLSLTTSIVNGDISASAAIAYSKLNLAGSIVNADINASAAIAGTKISPDFGAQNIVTTGGLTISGVLATKKGTDFTTTGSSNDVSTSGFSLLRYTGAGTATITGFANGSDGKFFVFMNASSSTVSVSNNDSGSSAANRIITGTGASITMAAGASLMLEYDSGASFWRVVGGSGAGSLSVVTVTAGATIAAGTDVELVNSSSACTIVMPAVASGKLVRIKDSTGLASGANITVSGASGALLDGQSSAVITMNYGSLTYVSDGTNWFSV